MKRETGLKRQAAMAAEKMRAKIARAMKLRVCPTCGGPLRHNGSALECRDSRCGGIAAAAFKVQCFEAEARAL